MADEDTSSQPLIYEHERRTEGRAREGSPHLLRDTQESVDADEEVEPGLFVWALTFAAGLSGLLFGYDTGVISSTLVTILPGDLTSPSLPLSTLDKSLITSITALLAFFASPAASLLADLLGRKRVILVADGLFILGAFIQAFAYNVPTMIAGRGLIGLGVGCGSFVVPLYISELSPSIYRGRLVTIYSMFVTGGQVVAYVVGWALAARTQGWRWMVGLGAAPALIQLVLLFGMTETPRWLIKAGKPEEARNVLGRMYGMDQEAQDIVNKVMRRVEREALEEDAFEPTGLDNGKAGTKARLAHLGSSFKELWEGGANRRALVIACTLQGLQQFCGFNSLMYFSATIFQMLGFTNPTLTSLTVAITNFAFTIVAFYLIDRLGRRRILLFSIPFMILGLFLSAVAFNFVNIQISSPSQLGSARQTPPDQSTDRLGTFWPFAIVIAMTVYVAAYAIGLGLVPWQQSELFALRVRAVGSGLATATNWGSNFVVGLTFLPMMDLLTPSVTFSVYAVICAIGLASIWRIYPETSGLGLEDVRELLTTGWGIEKSMRRWKMRQSTVS